MRERGLAAVLLLSGCYIDAADRDKAKDRDRDGFFAAEAGGADCDDNNPTIHPGHFESCLDDVDSDCDGLTCPARQEVSMDALEPLLDLPDDVQDQFGAGLLWADVDGDGVGDLVVSAPGAADGVGCVFILPGPLDTATVTADMLASVPWLVGEDGTRDLRAEDALDLDGDGAEELLLTAKVPRTTGGEREETNQLIHYIVRGLPAAGPQAVTAASQRVLGGIWGEREIRTPHRAAQAIGDLDGDGLAEIMLRAPLSGAQEEGEVYLLSTIPLSADVAGAAWITLVAPVAGDRLGELGRRMPDLDGDGVPEVVVGAAGADLLGTDLFGTIQDVGAVYIFSLAGAEGAVISVSDADTTVLGAYAEAPIQEAFGVGDTDGDGLEELAVFIQTGAGQLALFRTLEDAPAVLQVVDSEVRLLGSLAEEFTSSFGRDLASQDVDGDGLVDLLVTASLEPSYAEDGSVEGVGAHYLFLGPVSGVQSPDHAAIRWKAGLGDLTPATPLPADAQADGTLDLLLGFGGNGGGATGRVYWLPDAFSSL